VADRVQWILDLQDRLSGPAARIERQLGSVKSQLRALDVQAKQSKLASLTDPLKKQRLELQIQRDKLLESSVAMKKQGASASWLSDKMKGAREATRDWFIILHLLNGGLSALAGKALAAGRAVAQAVSFKQTEMIGLKAFLGKDAGAVFEQLSGLAGKIGKTPESVVALGKSLAMVGMQAKHIAPVVQLLEDADAANPGAGEKIAGVLRNIYSNKKVTAGDIESLRGTLNVDKMYEDFGQKIGGKRNRIVGKQLLEHLSEIGAVGPHLGASTILNRVLQDVDGGVAGRASSEHGKTLEGRIQNVLTAFERMSTRLADSPGFKAIGKVLDNIADVFNPGSKTGQKMLARLERFSAAIGTALGPLTGPEGKKNMIEFFDALAKKIETTTPKVVKLATWVSQFASGVGALVSRPDEAEQASRGARGDAIQRELDAHMPSPMEAARDWVKSKFFGAPAVHMTNTINIDGAGKHGGQLAREIRAALEIEFADMVERSNSAKGGP
jgi:hypothetical protein